MNYKKSIFFLIYLLLIGATYGQKHDNNWTLGIGARGKKSMQIDFSFNRPTIISDQNLPPFDFYCSSMSDTMGNLVFYSNGLHIFNINNRIMLNGDTINPGKYWEVNESEGSYGYAFSGLTVPFPDHNNEYLHFHFGANLSHVDIPGGAGPLYLSRVDMNLEDGLGGVVEKNVQLLPSYLRYSKFDITKHANGRDWWILVFNFLGNEYYNFLISPNGIKKTEYYLNRPIGDKLTPSRTKFSPDGSKFAVMHKAHYITIFDFDRCTGELNNRKDILIPIHADLSEWESVLEFSPNSKFLYIGNIYEVYQIYVMSDAEELYPFCVAECDLHVQTLPTSFIWSQLGPNGKIYISSGNGNEILHVINRPNLPGLICDVQQHGLVLPEENFLGIPYFPNYRLGALEGGECDTLQGVIPKVEIIDSTNGDFKFAGKWYKYAYKP